MKRLLLFALSLTLLFSSCSNVKVSNKTDLYISKDGANITIPKSSKESFIYALEHCRFMTIEGLYNTVKIDIEFVNHNKTVVLTEYDYYERLERESLYSFKNVKEKKILTIIEANRKYLLRKLK